MGFDGTISPGGLLPLRIGNVRRESLKQVYRENPVLVRVRARGLTGRCGACEFRHICGGSRARAYAVHGDALSLTPPVSFQRPGSLRRRVCMIATRRSIVDISPRFAKETSLLVFLKAFSSSSLPSFASLMIFLPKYTLLT